MADSSSQITVDMLEDRRAIRMVWPHSVASGAVRDAFASVTQLLKQSDSPVYVLVDIRSEPNFPVVETAVHALAGPQRHANLAGWLVVGSSPAARKIEGMLTQVTGKQTVQWFDTEEEALEAALELTKKNG